MIKMSKEDRANMAIVLVGEMLNNGLISQDQVFEKIQEFLSREDDDWAIEKK